MMVSCLVFTYFSSICVKTAEDCREPVTDHTASRDLTSLECLKDCPRMKFSNNTLFVLVYLGEKVILILGEKKSPVNPTISFTKLKNSCNLVEK